jgi:hypothetical protein
LQNDLCAGFVFVDLARQDDVDPIAWKDKAAHAFHVIDPNGHSFHAILYQRRQSGSLARTGNFQRKDRFVGLHRRKDDPLAAGEQLSGAGEGSGRHRILRPGDLAHHGCRELHAVTQRFRGDYDVPCGPGLLLSLETPHPHLRLTVQPRLRDENREEAEQNGKADHDDGTGTHERYSCLTQPTFRC